MTRNEYEKIRIYLTEKCNQRCKSCFNKDVRRSKHIDTSLYFRAVRSFRLWGYKRISFLGGEPLLHPEFSEIYQETQQCLPEIRTFTNGTISLPLSIKARRKDSMVYNFNFVRHGKFIENIISAAKTNEFRNIMVNIIIRVDETAASIAKNVDYFTEALKDNSGDYRITPIYVVSLDTTSDIIRHKSKLALSFASLLSHLNARNLKIELWQRFPGCFMTEGIDNVMRAAGDLNRTLCTLDCMGLIDVDFNIQSCGVLNSACTKNRIDLQNIFDKSGRPITFNDFDRALRKIYNKKINMKSEICTSCEKWGDKCNMGCFLGVCK